MSKPEHLNPYSAEQQPGDGKIGEWSPDELHKMDSKFCEAMQRAARAETLKRLTGEQLRAVLIAARQLRQRSREQFFQVVAEQLVGREVGNGSLDRAIRKALEELNSERTVVL